MLAGALDLDEVGLARGVAAIGGVFVQDFAVADDRVERCAQFMAHIGEKCRFGARRGFGEQTRLLRLILGHADFARIVAEHRKRAAHVAELVRGALRNARVERAARHGDHAARQLAQPRDDITDDKEPNDKDRRHQAHERNADQPEAAVLERGRRKILGIGRFLFRRIDQRRDLRLHVGHDVLQRRLQAGGGGLLYQFVVVKLKQPVLARAEIDELLYRLRDLGQVYVRRPARPKPIARPASDPVSRRRIFASG